MSDVSSKKTCAARQPKSALPLALVFSTRVYRALMLPAQCLVSAHHVSRRRQPPRAPRRNHEADAVPLIGLATSDRHCVRAAHDGSVQVPAASRSSEPICRMVRTADSLTLPARIEPACFGALTDSSNSALASPAYAPG